MREPCQKLPQLGVSPPPRRCQPPDKDRETQGRPPEAWHRWEMPLLCASWGDVAPFLLEGKALACSACCGPHLVYLVQTFSDVGTGVPEVSS